MLSEMAKKIDCNEHALKELRDRFEVVLYICDPFWENPH
jgi:hypothetical protein